jgi:hypothetical protein
MIKVIKFVVDTSTKDIEYENNEWPCGGMVDTRDSKSLIRKGVTVQVCSGPPVYFLLKI